MVETNPQNHDVVRIPKTCSYQKYFSNYGKGYKLCMDYNCKKKSTSTCI